MKIRKAALEVLDQLYNVIGQVEKSKYQLPIPRLGHSTLGEHIRHTLEFLICLKEGTLLGKINYDNRRRDQSLETNPEIALETIKIIKEYIYELREDLPLKLEVDYGYENANVQIIETNLSRELAYNIEHAVHHMAILKIGLAEIASEIILPDGFGIAVSTMRHRREKVL